MESARWRPGDTVIVRNLARSDGSVTTATPTIAIRDQTDLLALYIPVGALAKWIQLCHRAGGLR